MDQQEAQLRAQLQGTGVSVTRVGDKIILNMPSNITFDSDQSAVKPQFYETLNSVALVLQKFNRSLVDVAGHTDSTGSDQYNLTLSQQRAQSVSSYLISQGNDARRFYVQGFGESRPIADNGTDSRPRGQPPRGNPDFAAELISDETVSFEAISDPAAKVAGSFSCPGGGW